MSTRVAPESKTDLRRKYQEIREFSLLLASRLTPEDCVVQSMPDASPTRWHLAHTTWFFETFVLSEQADYKVFDERFSYLLNSYYNSVGGQFPRSQRGVITRPSYLEVLDYRSYVDEHMLKLLDSESSNAEIASKIVQVGLNHEQQHQELVLTDIKHAFGCNPLYPPYMPCGSKCVDGELAPSHFVEFDGGIVEVGHEGDGFAFDNESPRHRVFLEPYALSDRVVSNGEFLEFVDEGGYEYPQFWLSLGWAQVQEQGWKHPLYWTEVDGQWHEFTLAGLLSLDPGSPLTHINYFEADAFARWKGARLPTEAEWEAACEQCQPGDNPNVANFANDYLEQNLPPHPSFALGENNPLGLYGNVWEWTSSSYSPYPGYSTPKGAIGEYNGKFMCNQYVLRGGSCATPRGHMRPTYRNFFPPEARWQFSGIRLANS